MRTRRLAYRTEQIYLHWIRRYVNFNDRKHPRGLGHEGVEKFLSHLAVEAKVGASTQNQALQALLFLYRQVLDIDLPWLENVTRASRPKRLTVVLTPSEVRSVLAQLEGTTCLVANLLYGSGLRLMESLRLRVQDVVMERCEVIVRDAKGGKDRVTVLPETILHALRAHLQKLHVRFEQQRAAGAPGVTLPTALMRKYPNASTMWGWQYVFPADCRRVATRFGIALPLVYWKREPTFVRSKNCWAILTFAPPCSTRTSSERAQWGSKALWTD
jgi:integron integrase